MRISWPTILLPALFLLVSAAILFPNSFGNNPDIIQDESYFLTSALASIQKHTLPGWEFSSSGAYYGGPQTYLDTLALVPVVAYEITTAHFSIAQAEVQLALHTGDLLQVLRLADELVFVLAIGLLFWYFRRREIPSDLAMQLLLVLFLLLGNSLVIGVLHTTKVWSLALLIEVLIGILFLVNEYYWSQRNELFISKRLYAALMVWGVVLAFFQNFIGIFTAALWMLYAILLGHFQASDVWIYLRKRWYLIAGFAFTQISFFYRGIIERVHPSLLDYAGNSTRTAAGTIDWSHRLYDPAINTLLSEPLIVLYPLAIVLYIALFARDPLVRNHRHDRIYFWIAVLNPILAFAYYYAFLGFSLFPRYSLMFAVACTFSAAMLLVQRRRLLIIALIASGALGAIVLMQSIRLFWQPSSAVLLEQTITTHYNMADEVFIIKPAAARLALPINGNSLMSLNDNRKTFSRFHLLVQYPTFVRQNVSFAPTVLFADTAQEENTYLAEYATSTSQVWAITQDCSRMCTATEISAGSCFQVNPQACQFLSTSDQKEYPVLTLVKFLSGKHLGITYIARLVH